MNLVVFEDSNSDGFYPLSVSHPVFELLYGCYNVIDRLNRYYQPENIFLVCREYLADIAKQKYGFPVNDFSDLKDDCLLVNASLKPDTQVYNNLLSSELNTAFFNSDNVLIGARLSADVLNTFPIDEFTKLRGNLSSGIQKVETNARVFKHLWDLVNFNAEAINFDLNYIGKFGEWSANSSANDFGDKAYIHPLAEVSRSAFIDTSNGPVIVDSGATIEPRTLIQGPVYIGKKSKMLAGIIREGCSIGPVCKVGGELEETIILGHSNKAHEGFIGHAYIGEWVNLGALTTNSDLKNNYSEIVVRLNGVDVSTGSIKVGCYIGDHTKTGIGTALNTGIAIGFCCNLYGGALFLDKEIGHFKWGMPSELTGFKLGKAVELAKNIMSRRNMEFTSADENLFKEIYVALKIHL